MEGFMKVQLEFDIENLDELDKVTKEIEKVIPKYTVKMEIESNELREEA